MKHHFSIGRQRYERKEAFEVLRREYGEVSRELVNWGKAALPAELAYACYERWLRSVEEATVPEPADPRYG